MYKILQFLHDKGIIMSVFPTSFYTDHMEIRFTKDDYHKQMILNVNDLSNMLESFEQILYDQLSLFYDEYVKRSNYHD